MFSAAFTSRSCTAPHSPHTHSLTTRPSRPLGPPIAPQPEQVWVEKRSLTSRYTTFRAIALYSRKWRNIDQPASLTDFAMFVLVNLELQTSPTTINSHSFVSLSDSLCKKSLRRFAILACRFRACRERFFRCCSAIRRCWFRYQ